LTDGKKVSIIYLYLKGKKMESFIANFMIAVLMMIVGGGIVLWCFNYIIEELENLSNFTFSEWIGIMILLFIAALIAVQM
jgi:hypothetical protein